MTLMTSTYKTKVIEQILSEFVSSPFTELRKLTENDFMKPFVKEEMVEHWGTTRKELDILERIVYDFFSYLVHVIKKRKKEKQNIDYWEVWNFFTQCYMHNSDWDSSNHIETFKWNTQKNSVYLNDITIELLKVTTDAVVYTIYKDFGDSMDTQMMLPFHLMRIWISDIIDEHIVTINGKDMTVIERMEKEYKVEIEVA